MGKGTRQTAEEVGRQHQEMDQQAWSLAGPRGRWRTGKMEETGFEITCGAQTTLVVKE